MVALRELGVDLWMHTLKVLFASFQLRPIIMDHVLEAQCEGKLTKEGRQTLPLEVMKPW